MNVITQTRIYDSGRVLLLNEALGDIQKITEHIADSSSEMNQGTDRILHTLKRRAGSTRSMRLSFCRGTAILTAYETP